MSLLVVGSVALDTVSNPYGTIEEGLGGSAVYFALAAIPFTTTSIVAVIGTDFPKEHINLLKQKGIDVEGLNISKGRTFRWSGKYSDDLNIATTLDTQLNVFADFKPKLPAAYKKIPSLFLANIDPKLQLDVLDQIESPQFVGFDTMNFWIDGQRDDVIEVMKRVNIIFINEDEAKMLTNKKHLLDCAESILKAGPQTAVIKRGSAGVALFQENKMFAAPVYLPTRAVDTTGAGDSFAGGFMAFVDRTGNQSWETLKRAAVIGTLIASFNIEAFSITRLNMLQHDEIKTRWQEFSEITSYGLEPLDL